MSELDEKLKKIASENWEEFLRIVGDDSIVIAKARLLRKEGKSYNQISIKLSITESKARYACNKDDKQG